MAPMKHIKLWWSKFFLTVFLGLHFASPNCIVAQENLILNPDCEIYDTCPDYVSQIEYLKGWSDFPFWSTTDYLNECSNYEYTKVPYNKFGFQIPHKGKGYIHIHNVVASNPINFQFYSGETYGYTQLRESFICTLTQPLRKVPHYLEYYVSLASLGVCNNLEENAIFANNAFDILLMKERIDVFNGVSPYINQFRMIKVVKDNNIIKDTLDWVKLSVCFVPDGGEKYIAFGAFRDTSEIVYEFSGCNSMNIFLGSYFFDSFSLTECDTCCLGEFPYTDHLTIKGNPGSSGFLPHFEVLLNPNTTATLGIYDSAGRLVFSESFHNLYTDYKPQQQLAGGVYHYRFSTSNGLQEVGKVLVVP